jgi:hypothetical protein
VLVLAVLVLECRSRQHGVAKCKWPHEQPHEQQQGDLFRSILLRRQYELLALLVLVEVLVVVLVAVLVWDMRQAAVPKAVTITLAAVVVHMVHTLAEQ